MFWIDKILKQIKFESVHRMGLHLNPQVPLSRGQETVKLLTDDQQYYSHGKKINIMTMISIHISLFILAVRLYK